MRYLLPVLFVLMSHVLTGQVVVDVTPTDTTVCYRDSVRFVSILSGNYTGTITYRWQFNFSDIPGATDSTYKIEKVQPSDTGYYRCIVLLDGNPQDTSPDGHLRMHPRMKIETFYRSNALGCFKECKGQYKVRVSGGLPFSEFPDYIYEWGGGKSQDTMVFGLCPRTYRFKVTDSLGCSIDSNYTVEYLHSPKVEIKFAPRDTVYLTNPTVIASFNDTMRRHIVNWTWDFRDSTKIENVNPATHIYESSGDKKIRLFYTDLNGCDTVYERLLTVKVAELEIPNVFTPNNDGHNDTFEVLLKGEDKTKDYREAYLGNEFAVYDRWGRRVFKKDNYQSEDWDGGNLSDGTYYFILKCTSQWGTDVFRGSVTILRGGN
jgi:gliding motility-associated-like protein